MDRALVGGVAVLERAVAYTLGSLAMVTPEALWRPTPCRHWDLYDLLEHLHDSMAARAYYSLALEAAREADDHLQAAGALAHVAFIPAAEHGFTAALDYLHGRRATQAPTVRPGRVLAGRGGV